MLLSSVEFGPRRRLEHLHLIREGHLVHVPEDIEVSDHPLGVIAPGGGLVDLRMPVHGIFQGRLGGNQDRGQFLGDQVPQRNIGARDVWRPDKRQQPVHRIRPLYGKGIDEDHVFLHHLVHGQDIDVVGVDVRRLDLDAGVQHPNQMGFADIAFGGDIFIVGGEESYGYLVGDFVRDKDAVSACAMIAETAAWAADHGKILFDLLTDIYLRYAFHKESLFSVTRKGKTGADEIQEMMLNYRSKPLKSINGVPVICTRDYLSSREKDMQTGSEIPLCLPVSDVLQFFLLDGSVISVRPSGTEPKIKYYFAVRELLPDKSKFAEINQLLDQKIHGIIRSLQLD